jgi:hypothetical protein
VNILIFAIAILAIFCGEEAKNLLLKIVGSFLAGLMTFHDVLPLMLGDELLHISNETTVKNILSKIFTLYASICTAIDSIQAGRRTRAG